MPRDLTNSEKNELVIYDSISQADITFYYRMPTNTERIQFDADSFTGKGKKVKPQSAYAQMKYGARILTGIKDGDFSKDGKNISSEKDSPDFVENWKELVQAAAGDLVQLLGRTIFQGAIPSSQEDDAAADSKEAEDIPGLDMAVVNDSESEADSASPLE